MYGVSSKELQTPSGLYLDGLCSRQISDLADMIVWKRLWGAPDGPSWVERGGDGIMQDLYGDILYNRCKITDAGAIIVGGNVVIDQIK